MICLAVDVMGGDIGPSAVIPACLALLSRNPNIRLRLYGDETKFKSFLVHASPEQMSRVVMVHTDEAVGMDDSLAIALRAKRNSSMRLAIEAVKKGEADACVSAGNTGALMAIARLILKTLGGIDRPAIVADMPNQNGATTVLDLGANVDCSAEHLLQFAIMGNAFAMAVRGIANPRVGLLNIGEEVIKGNEVVKQAGVLLAQSHANRQLNFIGNVEGNDIFKGKADVVVCDGFVGNVALKTSEGLAQMLAGFIREEFTRTWFSKLMAVGATRVLARLKQRVDHRRYNGACLVGLRGIVFKSHGAADAQAFGFALDRAASAAANDLLGKTREILERSLGDSLGPSLGQPCAQSTMDSSTTINLANNASNTLSE